MSDGHPSLLDYDDLQRTQNYWRVDAIEKQLTIHYDKIGDILYLNTCQPYSEQESEELGDEIIARFNPISGTIENLEVLFFTQRIQPLNLLTLPIGTALSPVA